MLMSKAPTTLAGLVIPVLALVAAHAQGQPAGQNYGPPGAAPPPSGAPEAAAAASPAEDRALSAPVFSITSVEVIRSSHGPVMDIIRVRGLTSTSGWEEAELVPLTRGIPADGILELVFVARAPASAAEASGFETVEAIFPLEPAHPYRGVNVHSASDSVAVAAMPGYAEGKGAGDDCSKCVGKIFVAKGAPLPPGKAAAEVVREEQLPRTTRVIRPSDGIASAESNPNRLTLILNREGKIKTAIWD
jgi:hypothetical protein